MSKDLSLKQERWIFTDNVAKLIQFINSKKGYKCAIGETLRPLRLAKIYAAEGIGVKDSIHEVGLGVDIQIYKDGFWLKDTADYEFAGVFWKLLGVDNKWGGDFKRKDGNHFSQAYQGRA